MTREVVATIAIPSALIPAFKEWFDAQAKAASTVTTLDLS